MKTIRLKNNTETADYWIGVQIQPAEYYEIQNQTDLDLAINSAKVNQDIWASPAKLIINDGTNDLDASLGDKWLKGTNITEVTTQFEKRDKIVKLASAQADVNGSSIATILIKIPGTPNTGEGRWIDGGIAWFDEQHKDDRILSVEFTDEDNLLGYGVGTVVGSYTDTEVDSIQQGWRIPNKRGMIEVIAMGGYGFAPAGFYLKVTGKKGGSITTGTLYMNVMWGKQE